MRFLPSRRWFQFRLSTAFVLVGILCGMLSCRPYVVSIFGEYPWIDDDGKLGGYWIGEHRMLNPALLWPGMALMALLGWKASCALRRLSDSQVFARIPGFTMRRWQRFRFIGTWLIIAWLALALYDCQRPYVVRMIGEEVPPSDENPFPFLVGEQSFLSPEIAVWMLLFTAFLGWQAVGLAERFKKSQSQPSECDETPSRAGTVA